MHACIRSMLMVRLQNSQRLGEVVISNVFQLSSLIRVYRQIEMYDEKCDERLLLRGHSSINGHRFPNSPPSKPSRQPS